MDSYNGITKWLDSEVNVLGEFGAPFFLQNKLPPHIIKFKKKFGNNCRQ